MFRRYLQSVPVSVRAWTVRLADWRSKRSWASRPRSKTIQASAVRGAQTESCDEGLIHTHHRKRASSVSTIVDAS